MLALDRFDGLCRNVFMPSSSSSGTAWAFTTSADLTNVPSSEAEHALSLLLQAQPYELARSPSEPDQLAPSSPPAAAASPRVATSKTTAATTAMHRRLPLESVGGPVMEQRVLSILRQAGLVLLELPYDRNMGGSHALQKSRFEALSNPTTLDRPVVLTMDDDAHAPTPTSMWLIPEDDWVQCTARVRFWRQESHRIKAAERHATLVRAIQDRWTLHRQVVAPPPALDQEHQGQAQAQDLSQPSSLSSSGTLPDQSISPQSTSFSSTSAAVVSPTPPMAYQCYRVEKASQKYQPPLSSSRPLQEQEEQEQALLAYIHQYGDELSARSIIRGLLDFIRQQICDPQLLTWTLDAAHLTEQKLECTVALLDLLVCLGLERVDTAAASLSTTTAIGSFNPSTVNSNSPTTKLSVSTSQHGEQDNGSRSQGLQDDDRSIGQTPKESMDELVWTFGLDADDRRLARLVEMLHQNKDPARSLSKAIRDRYLHDRHTIAAGSVTPLLYQPWSMTLATVDSLPFQEQGQQQLLQHQLPPPNAIYRRSELVLARSRWSKSTRMAGHGGSGEGAVGRARKDLADLARWASSCCSGRLDWLWRWFYGWLRPNSSRRYGGNASPRGVRHINGSSNRTGRRLSSTPKLSPSPPHPSKDTPPPLAQPPSGVVAINGQSPQKDDDDLQDMDVDSTVVAAHRIRSNDENV